MKIFNDDATHEVGIWYVPPYNATDFKGSGSMTWTVPSASLNSHQFGWTQTGKVLTMWFQLENTTIGGTISNELAMRIPNGGIPTGWNTQPVCYATFVDPVTTSWTSCPVYVTTGYPSNPFMGFVKMAYTDSLGVYHPTGENWNVWSGNPTVNLYAGPIVLAVQ